MKDCIEEDVIISFCVYGSLYRKLNKVNDLYFETRVEKQSTSFHLSLYIAINSAQRRRVSEREREREGES